MTTSTKSVEIRYFALLREKRGLSSEICQTSAANASELFAELNQLHSFSLPQDRLAVAINDEFCSWDKALENNDKVVFIQPVAGG